MTAITTINLLPYDGIVYYFGIAIPADEASHYFDAFLEDIAWQPEEAIIYGRRITTKRMVAWYGDKAYAYTYSGVSKQALPWGEELLEVKQLTEQISGERFNSCLLNLYHDGKEGMGWHSDNERTLQNEAAIASLSLGAGRKFSFRHKQSKEVVSLMLEPGSLLVMKGATQTHWHHGLPKTASVKDARINLTFRSMKER